MARNSVVVTLFAALLFVGGCANETATTMTYTRDQALPPLAEVTVPTRYGLYPEGNPNPIWSEELAAGDEYGFVKRADGIVYGVAKGKDITLPDQKAKMYYWKLQKPAQSVGDE